MTNMMLNTRSVQLLKNFAQINQSLVFKPGSSLATYSPGKTIFAKAKIAEEFEKTFAIYDLPRFLNVLSLFDDPEIEVKDTFMTISSGAKTANYVFADMSLFQGRDRVDAYNVNAKDLFPSVEVSLELSQDNLQDIKKALSVYRMPEVAIIGDGLTTAIEIMNSKDPTSDVYSIDLGETDKRFRFIFKEENLRIIPGDYKVDIHWSNKKLARFTGEDIQYFIALESNSTYEG
jgi:hypothetical protein